MTDGILFNFSPKQDEIYAIILNKIEKFYDKTERP